MPLAFNILITRADVYDRKQSVGAEIQPFRERAEVSDQNNQNENGDAKTMSWLVVKH